MKRFLLIALCSLTGWGCFAQPDVFFGLKFGEKYSLEDMISAIGNNGTYEAKDQTIFTDSIVLDTYLFSNVQYGNSSFPAMVLEVSAKTGSFVGVSFQLFQDEVFNAEAMERTYQAMVDSLQSKYSMMPVPMEDSSVTRLSSVSSFSLGVVHLDKKVENGSITSIGLMYISFTELALEVLNDLTANPDIQDSFMGLKLGEKYTQVQVKNAMASRATYESLDRGGSVISYCFKDVSFAGDKWEFGNLFFTNDNMFMSLLVYDSYDNTLREKRAAISNFNVLKEKLDDKYGSVDLKNSDDDIERTATYFGGNDVAVMLSLEEQKSKAGYYRIYLKLQYIQVSLFKATNQLSNDEL